MNTDIIYVNCFFGTIKFTFFEHYHFSVFVPFSKQKFILILTFYDHFDCVLLKVFYTSFFCPFLYFLSLLLKDFFSNSLHILFLALFFHNNFFYFFIFMLFFHLLIYTEFFNIVSSIIFNVCYFVGLRKDSSKMLENSIYFYQ